MTGPACKGRGVSGRLMAAGYRLAAPLVLIVAGGCLTPEHRPPAASAELKSMQCHTQRITGSLVATRVCTVKFQRDAMQQDVKDAVDFINKEKIGACPGPGCN